MRAYAQESNAPAVTQQQAGSPAAAPAADAAKAEETPKSEKEEMDVYRHAPIVKTIAGLLHLDLETTARIFEFINFAIIVLAVGIPLVRVLPKLLHTRRHALQEDLRSARKMTEEARERLAAVESKLAKLDEEITQIRVQAEEEGKGDEQRIKASMGVESARVVAAAEQEIAAATALARRGLRDFAAELAIEQATKQLVLTPESDHALLEDFLRDAARRGQN
ncbi:MAG: ATP synthase F0 subunit B [Terracidiphilus sp.]